MISSRRASPRCKSMMIYYIAKEESHDEIISGFSEWIKEMWTVSRICVECRWRTGWRRTARRFYPLWWCLSLLILLLWIAQGVLRGTWLMSKAWGDAGERISGQNPATKRVNHSECTGSSSAPREINNVRRYEGRLRFVLVARRKKGKKSRPSPVATRNALVTNSLYFKPCMLQVVVQVRGFDFLR